MIFNDNGKRKGGNWPLVCVCVKCTYKISHPYKQMYNTAGYRHRSKTRTNIDHNTKKINFIILFRTISMCEQRVGWQQWSFLTSLLFFFPTTMNSILIQWPNSYSSTSKGTKPIATTVLNSQPVNLKPMSATPVLTLGILTKMVKLRDFHNHQFELKRI